MVRWRAAEAGFKVKLGCHVFRATGIIAYLEPGGTLENAQAMSAHESPRTTKLYDRTSDAITLDAITLDGGRADKRFEFRDDEIRRRLPSKKC